MSSVKEKNGKVTLTVAVMAEKTNGDHDPVFETDALHVPADNPVVAALGDGWLVPRDAPGVRQLEARLRYVLALFLDEKEP